MRTGLSFGCDIIGGPGIIGVFPAGEERNKMTSSYDSSDLYRSLGVRPIINAAGTTTLFGGTRTRPESLEAMAKAARVLVNLDELNLHAGKVIAEMTGAEAGLVTNGAAAGLVLQAAACIAGSDMEKMARLPDTEGMKNEFIIQRCHRFPYDQAYRLAGAKLVEIGEGRRCYPWQLEAAFTERTAAVVYLHANFVSRRAIPLELVCEIAHARGVPVIVDGASMLPPRENLRKYISEGADMVIFSGGKGVKGPQGSGILCGRADLIKAAFANASPHQFVGRSMKVAKEEVIGLLTALQIFVEEDEEEENERYLGMMQQVVDALIEVPGLQVQMEHDGYDYTVPSARINFTRDWAGPTPSEVFETMASGPEPIYLSDLGNPDDLTVVPTNLEDEEVERVITRLREVLLGAGG